ncbi:DMT family transporter [Streptomyces sp. LHD-70]|uniref:DMT family transporter n=1 Tax=Streptomyces sp. LHD-70 TaxID=3072140 RepID=UPI00280F5DE1|nr:DMT family transporter [Streptomyces sp. LHD-70]MDQ8707938.1 DMT family transporter [Streptomyces sp. LHD-70]
MAVLSAALAVLLTGTWLLSGALAASTPPMAVAAGRTGFCFVALMAVAVATGTGRAGVRAAARRPGTAVLLGFLGFFAYAAGTLGAMPLIGTSRTNVVVTLLPCLSFVLGVMFFRERAGARKAVGTMAAAAAACGYAMVNGGTSAGTTEVAQFATGVGLAFAATLGFALYGFVYRRGLADVAPLAALPVILGPATVMLLPLALPALDEVAAEQWLGIAVLGVLVYAPAYVVQHRLILLRGPLFTAAVQLVVPFLVRISGWALGIEPAPGAQELALLAVCCAGIWLVVSDRTPAVRS